MLVFKRKRDHVDTSTMIPDDHERLRSMHETVAPSPYGTDATTDVEHKSGNKPASWYSPTVWRGKLSFATDTLFEPQNHSAASQLQPELLSQKPFICRSNVYQHSRASRKGDLLAAAPTRVHAMRSFDLTQANDIGQSSVMRREAGDMSQGLEEHNKKGAMSNIHKGSDASQELNIHETRIKDSNDASSRSPTTVGWHGWWSRRENSTTTENMTSTGRHATNEARIEGSAHHAELVQINVPTSNHKNEAIRIETRDSTPSVATYGSSRSWLPGWTRTRSPETNHGRVGSESLVVTELSGSQLGSKTTTESIPNVPLNQSGVSGWAFWSATISKLPQPASGETQPQVDAIAVADSVSRPCSGVVQSSEQPVSIQHNDIAESERRQKHQGGIVPPHIDASDGRRVVPNLTNSTTSHSNQSSPNMVLPSFDMYPKASNLGYWERASSYVSQTLRWSAFPRTTSEAHIHSTVNPPKISKAVAIGVHGFYPSQMVRMVLGAPTGTSVRFADAAASQIKVWCNDNQLQMPDIEIAKIALEGEGLVADRVSILWELLLNWLPQLRAADLIFVACHSQGVPVACMLVAKLIEFGGLARKTKVGICAMAGINLGPFPEYKVRFFGGSALELFDFGQAHSKVSKAYTKALDTCLRYGVRITYIGSLDDQLVSLESSLFMPLKHPYVNRAVFVDGRLHRSNFLTHLVTLALKLRNLGHSDHGLIRELSRPLAGSLVGGDGHSRLYDNPRTYYEALDFTLKSTDIGLQLAFTGLDAVSNSLARDNTRPGEATNLRPVSLAGKAPKTAIINGVRRGSTSSSVDLPGTGPIWLRYDGPPSSQSNNPFYLPWAVRGMLEEQAIKNDTVLQTEVLQLLEEFNSWNPASKAMKDVRWRLKGIQVM